MYEPECREVRQRALSGICHDIAGIAGVLGGYSDIFKSILVDDMDKTDTLSLLTSAQLYIKRHLSMMNSVTDVVLSVSFQECEDELTRLVNEIKQIVDTDISKWSQLLDNLNSTYNNENYLDTEIINQMAYHASHLATFHHHLLEEIRKDFS